MLDLAQPYNGISCWSLQSFLISVLCRAVFSQIFSAMSTNCLRGIRLSPVGFASDASFMLEIQSLLVPALREWKRARMKMLAPPNQRSWIGLEYAILSGEA